MADRLEGTVALITGASSGIGAATARHLAGLGASVALVARRADRLEELADTIRSEGGTALAVATDVTDPNDTIAAVERTASEFGRLDTLVNNAGVMLLGPVVGSDIDEWNRMVDLNVSAMLHVAHAALPHLLDAAQKGPRQVADMVNISSVAGRKAQLGGAVYNLTKFGVGAFSEALRQEVTRRHLRVSVVEPGSVDTELRNHLRPEILEIMQKQFDDMERLEADDIAEAIGYIVTRPRRMAVNEILIRPTEQVG